MSNKDPLNFEGWELPFEMPTPEQFEGPFGKQTYEMEIEFATVDPDVLDILTGSRAKVAGHDGTFTIEIAGYHKRKWWQWLLRRPRQFYHYFIPNARMVSGNETGEST